MPVWFAPFTDVIVQGIKVYLFVAGLVLIGFAFTPLANRYLNLLSKEALFWANMVSAALDNATIVALEVNGMELSLAGEAIIAQLISGGMAQGTCRILSVPDGRGLSGENARTLECQ